MKQVSKVEQIKQVEQDIKIKRTYLRPKQVQLVKNVLTGETSLTSRKVLTSEPVKNELKLILAENDLTSSNLISKLKTLTESEYEKPKASDHLKALELGLKLTGDLKQTEPDEQTTKLARKFEFSESGDLVGYIEEITTKTQDYLAKLKELEEPDQADP